MKNEVKTFDTSSNISLFEQEIVNGRSFALRMSKVFFNDAVSDCI